MSIFKNLQLERRGPALWIWLNRPEVKNAFTLEMAEDFLQAVQMGMKDKTVSVLVLSGRGGVWSAGGDIKKMSETQNLKKFFLQISRTVNRVLLEIRNGKPVLAAIPGYVGGIAFGAVLAADLRIASSTAQFNAATIRLGLVANGGATYFLPRLVGLGRATEILLLGDILSAEQALQVGLVGRVVPPESLERETQSTAERLAAGPQQALRRLKKTLQVGLHSSLATQLERECQAIAWSASTEDFQEGMRAFLEKRKAKFWRC